MPCVAVTSLQCLQATGAPWANRTNVTVVITSGQGGTGFIGIQLAKLLSATNVYTAASGAGIPFVESLGANLVVDFTKQNIFDSLPDDSVDIVYDNYGAPGTADKAMHAIRIGGVFLVMDTGGGIYVHLTYLLIPTVTYYAFKSQKKKIMLNSTQTRYVRQ